MAFPYKEKDELFTSPQDREKLVIGFGDTRAPRRDKEEDGLLTSQFARRIFFFKLKAWGSWYHMKCRPANR